MMASLLALVAIAGADVFSQSGQSAAPLPAVASVQIISAPFQALRYEEGYRKRWRAHRSFGFDVNA